MKPSKLARPRLFPYPMGHSGQGWHAIAALVYCPREYQLATVRGIQQVSEIVPDYLGQGSLLHVARAQWLHDNRKGDLWQEAIRVYFQKAWDAGEKINPALVESSIKIFKGFVNYWKIRPVTETLAIEHHLDARGMYPGAPSWLWRTARYDSVERHHGKIWIGEAKSTSSSAGTLANRYALDGQLLLQMALWGEQENDTFGPLEGVLLDPILKTQMKGAPRIAIPKSRVQPALERFTQDFKSWVMMAQTINWNDKVEGRVTACVRATGTCQFRDLCSVGRNMAHRYEFKDGSGSILNWKPSPGKEVPPWS